MSDDRLKTHLSLAEDEERRSRLILYRVDQLSLIKDLERGMLRLSRVSNQFHLWEHLFVGDLLLCVDLTGGLPARLVACKVTGKSIETIEGIAIGKPCFVIHVHRVGIGQAHTLTWEAFLDDPNFLSPPRHVFEDLWRSCSRYHHSALPPIQKPIYSKAGYSVSIAESAEEIESVIKLMEPHPFGVRRAPFSFIAKRGNVSVGAVVVDLATRSDRDHGAAWRVFRSDYPWVREHAVTIVRICSEGTGPRFRIHRVLLEAILKVAPSLVPDPLSIIEGISYDYHPVARHLGFQVETPPRIEGSFYYWKPFSVPNHAAAPPFDKPQAARVHALLAKREEVRYWFARGSQENIELGWRNSAWAVRRTPENSGRWRCLRAGHIVFLASNEYVTRGYGLVEDTQLRSVLGFESFPLWIYFRKLVGLRNGIDISSHAVQWWFRRTDHGGLVPLSSEFGSFLKSQFDIGQMEGKMWVEPNPFLLRRTDFSVIPRQVFVVQSWQLRETVFPTIQRVLADHGYSAAYAGDREGQVVFEDVWLMLNESEIVLVDFTSRKPNVYLEYGMALVLGKPIVAITQTPEDIPSDTPNLKFIVYRDKLGDDSLLKQLPRSLRDTTADVQQARSARVGTKL